MSIERTDTPNSSAIPHQELMPDELINGISELMKGVRGKPWPEGLERPTVSRLRTNRRSKRKKDAEIQRIIRTCQRIFFGPAIDR